VGTGYLVAGQVTAESQALIEIAQKCFYLVADPATAVWISGLNETAESLKNSFAAGRERTDSYEEMVERMLAPVRQGLDVCAAFYGHPGVFVFPAHEAIRRARREGFPARMLPGISAEDCLFADLGIDPAQPGCQSFEASDFLLRHRIFDPSCHLILWQIGAIGLTTYMAEEGCNREGLRVLSQALCQRYGPDHESLIYEASIFPVCEPSLLRVPLGVLAEARVTSVSTLYVPPKPQPPVDLEMLDRLGIPRPKASDPARS
jgi:uncharacterized protein YabN with tetrapyrrole methylase and pyrophosphatase domain